MCVCVCVEILLSLIYDDMSCVYVYVGVEIQYNKINI